MKFKDKPDYAYLRNLFKDGLKNLGYQNDKEYDWVILAKQRKKELELKQQAEL